jgi:acyl-CoA synthetase (AMP-forming)/AMP-acid ligase II
MNIANLLAQTAASQPHRIALTDLDAPTGRRNMSYGELWHRVQGSAAAMRGLGLVRGDRVAMLMGNSWEYVQTFLAIAYAGLVAVPMNTRLLEDELLHIVRDSGARLLVAQQSLLQARPGLKDAAPLGVVVARPAGQAAAGQRSFESFRSNPTTWAPTPVDGDALASINYTSGTTGLPKGAMLPHRAWHAVSSYARALLGFSADEVTIHTAALTHGSGFLLLPTIEVAGRAVLCAGFDPALTLRLFGSEQVTSGFMVPSMIRMLLDAHGSAPPMTGLALRALYYAGSPIDPGTLRGAMDVFGDVLIQSFAQTEIPMFLTAMSRQEHRLIDGPKPHLIRAAGRAVSGVELRLVDGERRDVPPGEPGEVIARGPHMMLGYWNRPQATAETIVDGWLHTGDVGRFDEEGYLYIIDRKKDMIISGGANVYAREVEEAILRLPGIREVAVIGLPHPTWGEMVTAVLVAEQEPLPESEVLAFCRQQLADYRRPKKLIWVQSLPRNAYGKVRKRELRECFGGPA